MVNTNLDSEIRSRIDAFVIDLSNLVKIAALESVADALGGQAAPPRRGRPPGRRGPGRPRGHGRPPKAANGRRVRGSSADLEGASQQVLAYIQANPGQRVDQIAKALGSSSKELKRPVAALLSQKAVRTEGQ